MYSRLIVTDTETGNAPPPVVGQARPEPVDIVRELIAAFEEMIESGEIDE